MTENEGPGAAATAAPPKPKSKATKYVVLRRTAQQTWEQLHPEIEAQSAEQAQRRAADAIAHRDGTDDVHVVAVPVRSWKPLTFSREVVERTVVKRG
jgi:hypothetical protein